MKKKRNIFVAIVISFMLGILSCMPVFAEDLSYSQLRHIAVNDFFNIEEDEYYVYFYYESCPDCNYVKNDFINFAKDRNDVFVVDYAIPENKVNGYDWSDLRSRYNKQIGTVDENGNITYFSGESQEKYLNIYNQFGKKVTFTFIIQDGGLYTNIKTPEIDYSAVTEVNQLIIAGVPTLLKVNNGVIEEFYYDYYEIYEFLEQYP